MLAAPELLRQQLQMFGQSGDMVGGGAALTAGDHIAIGGHANTVKIALDIPAHCALLLHCGG